MKSRRSVLFVFIDGKSEQLMVASRLLGRRITVQPAIMVVKRKITVIYIAIFSSFLAILRRL